MCRRLAWLTARQGVNVLLAVLVFATAITIEPASLKRVARELATTRRRACRRGHGPACAVLDRISSRGRRIIARWHPGRRCGTVRDRLGGHHGDGRWRSHALRRGAHGLHSGRGDRAGPFLSIEAGHAEVHPDGIIVNLALVVALPLVAGILLRSCTPMGNRFDRAATTTATVTVAALVALIAAEVHVSTRYLTVAAALVIFLAGSAIVGRVLGVGAGPPTAVAALLTTSMRDFAIAAALAATAFGPAAAAPLGLYGILVLIWGTTVAGLVRKRGAL